VLIVRPSEFSLTVRRLDISVLLASDNEAVAFHPDVRLDVDR
jgi:hypothetical protein